MDLSDGLAKDLARMCAASGCAARVRVADLPLSPGTARALATDPALVRSIVAAGDDYEVLAAVPAAQAAAFRSDAEAAGVGVTQIGTMASGTGVVIEDRDGRPLALDRTGWDHF
jgi:thiamine-monophosphate kinase